MKMQFRAPLAKRIDALCAEAFPEHSRNYFHYLIEEGMVTCNGKRIKKREIPNVGDLIEVVFKTLPEITLTPEPIPLEILYEDEEVLCINKPPQMVVHPAPGNPSGTLVNALLHYCHSLPPQELRPGIVHRLDKETSGVLLAAKTSFAHQKLLAAFAARKVQKEYLAVTAGTPQKLSLNAPIGRHPVKRKEMTLREDRREALTHFEVLEEHHGITLLRVRPITGRTHQIRVHLKSLNTPILGDSIYGSEKLSKKEGVKRLLLHAHRLTFPHPSQEKLMTITAPIPEDFKKWIRGGIPSL